MKPLIFLIAVLLILHPSSLILRAAEPLITSREGARHLPLPKGDDVFHFVIYGDRTGGRPEGIKILEQAVTDTNLLDPDLVMTVGDLVQGICPPAQWMTEMREYRGVMDQLAMPWYPVAGNHDIHWSRKDPNPPSGEFEPQYEKHFGPLWYAFKHKNAGFVVLYSEEGDPAAARKAYNKPGSSNMGETQLNWLRETLAELSSLDHVFAFIHHPRWIEHRYPDSNWPEVHRLLAAAGNVHACFAGHIHFLHYAGEIDGIQYHSLGATGSSVPGGVESIQLGILHHLDVVTVRKDSFSVSVLPVGSVMDPKKFDAARQDDVYNLTSLYKRVAIPELALAGDEGSGTADFKWTNPASRPIEIDLVASCDVTAWSFTPDHRHLVLQPGESVTASFDWRRNPGPNTGAPPELAVSIDYLGEGYRLTIPERTLTLKISNQ